MPLLVNVLASISLLDDEGDNLAFFQFLRNNTFWSIYYILHMIAFSLVSISQKNRVKYENPVFVYTYRECYSKIPTLYK